MKPFKNDLERQWATFFDTLNITWQYEPEAYTHEKCLRPAFHIPHLNCWVIVTEYEPSDNEIDSISELVVLTGKHCYLFFGELPYVYDQFGLKSADNSAIWITEYGDADCDHWWCICPVCGKYGIEYNGRGARVCGDACCPQNDKTYTWDDPSIADAYITAKTSKNE